jgi:hypothetical protein
MDCALMVRTSGVDAGPRHETVRRGLISSFTAAAAPVGLHRKGQSKPIRVNAESASVNAGVSRAVTLKLPRAAITGLTSGAKESARLTLTGRNANGSSQRTLTLARLKPKR